MLQHSATMAEGKQKPLANPLSWEANYLEKFNHVHTGHFEAGKTISSFHHNITLTETWKCDDTRQQKNHFIQPLFQSTVQQN